MSERAEHLRVPAVRFVRDYPGSAAKLWMLLTQCDELPAWFGEASRIEPRERGQVNLMGGHVRGVVTQWRPEARLAHTWNVFTAGEAASPYPESYLTLDLEPLAEAVRLTLTHLPVLERFEAQNAMGWHTFLDVLADAMAGRPARPRGEYMQKNAAIYGVDLNALQT